MKNKLLPTIIAAAGLLVAPFALSANTYQSEVSLTYADVENTFETDGYFVGLDGKYYFAPVNTNNHPLAEAAFIEKVSNVYVNLGNYEYKESGYRSDFYLRTLGADFYIPNTMFYLGAGVHEYKSKSSYAENANFDAINYSSKWDSTWFVKAGIAPITGLLVWSEFTEDVDVSDEWNINGKYVLPLSGEQALNIEASYKKSDISYADDIITGAVDYYFDRNLSLGGGFVNASFRDSDAGSTTDYFVRARNHFTDNVSVDLNYTDGDYGKSLAIGGTIRF